VQDGGALSTFQEDPCFRGEYMDLEVSFAGINPVWLNVGPIQFYQHDLVAYREEHQLTIDPIYGFGEVTMTIDGVIPTWPSGVNFDPTLFQCVWNNQYKQTQATLVTHTYTDANNPCKQKGKCMRATCPVPRMEEIMSVGDYDYWIHNRPFNSLVDLTLDGGETRSHFSVIYKYIKPFHIAELLPPLGPYHGTTHIRVLGAGFIKSPQLFCKFGDTAVPATFVSDILMTCTTPPMPNPGQYNSIGRFTHAFSYSVDGQYFQPVTTVHWTAMVEPQPNARDPVKGPYTGNVKVRVFGQYFQDVPTLECKFGVFSTKAIFVTQQEIICYAPSCKDAFGMKVVETDPDGTWDPCFGNVQLSVSLNRQEFFGNLQFRYLDRQRITNTAPWASQYDPVGMPIVLTGTKFEEPMYCRFHVTDDTWLPSVQATDVTMTTMKCQVPKLPAQHQPDARWFDSVLGFLEISPNNQDFTRDRSPWVWYREAQVTEILPKTLFHNVAPTGDFIVKGKNFRRLQADEQLQCQWYYDNNAPPELVSAYYLSPNELKCKPTKAAKSYTGGNTGVESSKSSRNRDVRLEVAMTKLSYSRSHKKVISEPQLQLLHHYDNQDQSGNKYAAVDSMTYDPANIGGAPRCRHTGGCPLGMRGRNLWNSEFVNEDLNKLYVVIGDTVVEAKKWFAYPHLDVNIWSYPSEKYTYGKFEVPPVPHRTPVSKMLPIYITRNLQDYSPYVFDIQLTYLKVDAGHYYRPETNNGTMVQSPRGHYSQGAINTNFSEWLAPPHYPLPCPSGTFQNYTGRGDCRPCPEGTYCPIAGNMQPKLCATGLICWGRTRFDANLPVCPAGVLCLRPPYGKTYKLPTSNVNARLRRLLIASETEPKFLDQVLDFVMTEDQREYLSGSESEQERSLLKRRLIYPQVKSRIDYYNQTLRNKFGKVDSFEHGSGKVPMTQLRSKVRSELGLDDDAHLSHYHDDVALGSEEQLTLSGAKQSIAPEFRAKKRKAKAILEVLLSRDFSSKKYQSVIGRKLNRFLYEHDEFAGKDRFGVTLPESVHSRASAGGHSIFEEDQDAELPEAEADEEEDHDDSYIHFVKSMNHYYYDHQELEDFINSHKDALSVLSRRERKRLLLLNAIGMSGDNEAGLRTEDILTDDEADDSETQEEKKVERFALERAGELGTTINDAQDFFQQSATLDRARRFKRHLEKSVLAAEIEDAKHASAELRAEQERNRRVRELRDAPTVTGLPIEIEPCPAGMYCPAGSIGQKNEDGSFTIISASKCSVPGIVCSPGSSIPVAVDTTVGTGQYINPTTGLLEACPAGFSCVGSGEPTACPPGQYQVTPGSGECSTCTAGTVCTGFGGALPELCPAGMVCVFPGRTVSAFQCPAGSYCLPGTFTLNSATPAPPGFSAPVVCPTGTYCLAGTGTVEIDDLAVGAPKACVEGTFCGANVTTPGGTDNCPEGWYCSRGVAIPRPAPLGHFVRGSGAMYPEKCRPGTFADTWMLTKCKPCPAGQECSKDGTVVPINCTAGTYRPAVAEGEDPEDSVFCVPCPQGTWAKQTGITSEDGCINCDERYICPVEGMTRFATIEQTCPQNAPKDYICYDNSQGEDCPEGFACGLASTYYTQYDFPCEPGYYCMVRTIPYEMRNLLCPPQFFCKANTGESSKKEFSCFANSFCPAGTAGEDVKDGNTLITQLSNVRACDINKPISECQWYQFYGDRPEEFPEARYQDRLRQLQSDEDEGFDEEGGPTYDSRRDNLDDNMNVFEREQKLQEMIKRRELRVVQPSIPGYDSLNNIGGNVTDNLRRRLGQAMLVKEKKAGRDAATRDYSDEGRHQAYYGEGQFPDEDEEDDSIDRELEAMDEDDDEDEEADKRFNSIPKQLKAIERLRQFEKRMSGEFVTEGRTADSLTEEERKLFGLPKDSNLKLKKWGDDNLVIQVPMDMDLADISKLHQTSLKDRLAATPMAVGKARNKKAATKGKGKYATRLGNSASMGPKLMQRDGKTEDGSKDFDEKAESYLDNMMANFVNTPKAQLYDDMKMDNLMDIMYNKTYKAHFYNKLIVDVLSMKHEAERAVARFNKYGRTRTRWEMENGYSPSDLANDGTPNEYKDDTIPPVLSETVTYGK
jgi:hypothetical protein